MKNLILAIACALCGLAIAPSSAVALNTQACEEIAVSDAKMITAAMTYAELDRIEVVKLTRTGLDGVVRITGKSAGSSDLETYVILARPGCNGTIILR